jgi:2-polyprenyl-3-methyl-5-hydroxy-6-metoxy-1,4-benzoquinol methylase
VAGDATARRDALVARFDAAVLGFQEICMLYIGDKLGLYRALADRGASTSGEPARATELHERYVREWLEQQAAAGILEVDSAGAPAAERRYLLPEGHREALTEPDSLAYLPPVGLVHVSMAAPMRRLLECFRSGGGIPFADYGDDCRRGIEESNRPLFLHLLASEWFPAVPDLHARLLADPPARVADVACGSGWSSIALAHAYPKVRVDGLDGDEASVAAARANAAEEEVGDRLRFLVANASDPALSGRYDLVTVFEAIHDMGRPVEALRALRGLLADGASVLVADERVGDSFTAPASERERAAYGYSVLHCLPAGLADHPQAVGTGTVMRASVFRAYAEEAGFATVETLPIENELWCFYRLRP